MACEWWDTALPHSNERFVSARASWAARVSGAGVDGEAVGGAGLMGEVNAVPVGQRHWPWSDRRQAIGAVARAASIPRFAFDTVLSAVEM